jgi:hypothetical protein
VKVSFLKKISFFYYFVFVVHVIYININFSFFLYIVICFLISNTYRILGNKKNVGQNPLYIIGTLFGLINGAARTIWGALMDKFGFKILMFIITLIEISVSYTIYYCADYPYIYVIENLLPFRHFSEKYIFLIFFTL